MLIFYTKIVINCSEVFVKMVRRNALVREFFLWCDLVRLKSMLMDF